METFDQSLSDIIGDSYPPLIEIGAARVRRNWVVRSRGTLPPQSELDDLADDLVAKATRIIDELLAMGKVRPTPERYPLVTLFRVDDMHLVIITDFADPRTTSGNEHHVSQWGVIDGFDRCHPIDDLQGLPADCWFPLRVAREGR